MAVKIYQAIPRGILTSSLRRKDSETSEEVIVGHNIIAQ